MLPHYKQPHYDVFRQIPFVPQSAGGDDPWRWAKKVGLKGVPLRSALPKKPLDRTALRKICCDPKKPSLFGYVCVMAWGRQSQGRRGNGAATAPWKQRRKIAGHLQKLRAGNLTRSEAYDLFCGKGQIEHLGPSYFTKLLYFFNPNSDFYIMDQWVAKSINLLTGEHIVRVYDSSPTRDNKGGNYQAYCEEIDHLAGLLSRTGDEIEQRLMSNGQPSTGKWREHVREHYPYDRARIQARYPHIAPLEL